MNVTLPTPDEAEEQITCGDFWPSIEPVKVREAMRIDTSVTAERLQHELIEAAANVTSQLDAWRLQLPADIGTLADVPAPQINEVSVNVHRFHRAVGCLAKASLMERYRDMDTTPSGDRKADQTDPTIDDLRRDALWAVRDITGKSRTTVALI